MEQNGCKLVIDNIVIDEDRLVMSIQAYNDKIEELLTNSEEGKPIRVSDKPKYKVSPAINLHFFDFKEDGYFGSTRRSDNKAYGVRVEKTFREGEVQDFLASNPDYISFSAEVSLLEPNQEKEVLETFANIKIPLDLKKIKMSKKFEVRKSTDLDKMTLNVNQLTISPTRMRVDVSFQLPNGYFLQRKHL